MLDERKAAILRTIVREYIATGQPVGSAHVAGDREVQVSPATVRNEMAVLEHEGFLLQPHTSAGRVPTDKAYRVFVDQLGRPGRLEPARLEQVREFFDHAHGALERMLADTTKLLSALTDYAAMVMAPPHEAATVRSVQLVGLSARVVLVVMVLSNGSVESETVELDDDVSEAVVGAASAHLASQLVGHAVTPATTLTPSSDERVQALASVALGTLRTHADRPDEHLFVGGTAALAASFEAAGVVRDVLATLEQQYVVVTLLRDTLDRGLSVAIGEEHGVQPLVACSVVVAPYVVDGEPVGTIGLLGPTRMNYPQALAAVDAVSQHLGRRLSEVDD